MVLFLQPDACINVKYFLLVIWLLWVVVGIHAACGVP